MDAWFLKFSSNFIDMILVRHCPATSCLDTSGYVGTQQDWQEHWNWGGESDFTSDQYYGNVAFFVPFQGMAGVAGDSSMTATASTGQGTSKTEGGESSQSLQEIAQKMAKLQAENQRLMHLCEVERRMRQIEVTAFQQTLEMYAVPHSEVDQLVRRFQEDGPTALYDGTNQYGLYSNAAATGATGSGTGTTAVSLESLLQDLYKKLYEPKESKDEKENDNSDTKDMKDTEEWVPTTPGKLRGILLRSKRWSNIFATWRAWWKWPLMKELGLLCWAWRRNKARWPCPKLKRLFVSKVAIAVACLPWCSRCAAKRGTLPSSERQRAQLSAHRSILTPNHLVIVEQSPRILIHPSLSHQQFL